MRTRGLTFGADRRTRGLTFGADRRTRGLTCGADRSGATRSGLRYRPQH